MKIMIDPGHGGTDPGAVYAALREADLALSIAGILWETLEYAGHEVSMTRTSDQTVPLSRRAELSDQDDFDLFVSIHINAAADEKARGMEVWTSPGKTAADPAASSIFAALKKAFGKVAPMRADFSDGDPDKESRFYVLTHTRCPAVLIECGFLSNEQDRIFLLDPENRTDLAVVIAQGIESWKGAQDAAS